MVSFWLIEFGLLGIGDCLLVLWPVKDVLHGKHGDNGQDLVTASEVDRHDEHLGQHRF